MPFSPFEEVDVALRQCLTSKIWLGGIEKCLFVRGITMADIGGVLERSLAVFDAGDLQRLSEIARKDLQRFIANDRESRIDFSSKILCVALCQGAALHQVNKTNGVKDIDVYTFFAADEGKLFPPRHPVMNYDFGSSKFGRHPDDLGYIGRRVDCLGRSIAYAVGTSPIEAL